jgi:protein SCO1/2
LIIGLVLLVAAMFVLPRGERLAPTAVATVLPRAVALPQVELIDHNGRRFSLDELRGRFTLLFFGFTNCPDVCPLTLKVLADTRAEILRRAPTVDPAVVFVSVDPSRDTPQRIASYLQSFDAAFIGATGSDETLAPLLKTLGVTVEKHVHAGENYNVVHNSTVYVLGPQAEWIALSSAPHDAATIAADYLKIRRGYAAANRTPSA